MGMKETLCAVTVSLALSGAPVPVSAQQAAGNEFRAEVYGMVCNQCAYGVEQALQHTDGVQDAIVDLKGGSIVVQASGTPPTPQAVVEKILDQGVSVRGIEATLVGRLEHGADGLELAVGSRRFPVESADGSPDLMAYVDRQVRLTGVFAGIEGVDGAAGSPRFVPSKAGG